MIRRKAGEDVSQAFGRMQTRAFQEVLVDGLVYRTPLELTDALQGPIVSRCK